MKVGDKVLYNNQIATIVRESRPKCRCKGRGYYLLEIEGSDYEIQIPLTTNLELYKPLTMANQNLEVHKF